MIATGTQGILLADAAGAAKRFPVSAAPAASSSAAKPPITKAGGVPTSRTDDDEDYRADALGRLGQHAGEIDRM
eukprot:5128727-Prorocentrum_lima.AAC.1